MNNIRLAFTTIALFIILVSVGHAKNCCVGGLDNSCKYNQQITNNHIYNIISDFYKMLLQDDEPTKSDIKSIFSAIDESELSFEMTYCEFFLKKNDAECVEWERSLYDNGNDNIEPSLYFKQIRNNNNLFLPDDGETNVIYFPFLLLNSPSHDSGCGQMAVNILVPEKNTYRTVEFHLVIKSLYYDVSPEDGYVISTIRINENDLFDLMHEQFMKEIKANKKGPNHE